MRLIAGMILLLAAGACRSDPQADLTYRVEFSGEFSAGSLVATIAVDQDAAILKQLSFAAPEARFSVRDYTGKLDVADDRWTWQPSAEGGYLTYEYQVDQQRGSAYDARLSDHGVMLRLDDVFPAAKVRTVKGARSNSELWMTSSLSWSFESRYGNLLEVKTLPYEGRNFTRPKGWLVGGKLATRREVISGRPIAVSAMEGGGSRHMDMLTFLQWIFPEVVEVLPDFPERLLIVVGEEGMWRGALSAPSSLYLHRDRPLVSGNGTSTLVHELLHVGGIHSAAEGDDWIVEGLAEYYSLSILRRAGGMSEKRYLQAMDKLTDWVAEDGGELASPSKGADTAYATLLFHRLDEELRQHGSSLDPVAARLARDGVSRDRLEEVCQELLGRPSRVLNAS